MSKIILQPSGNKDAREHYEDTLANPVKLSSIEKFISQKHKEVLDEIYPDGNLFIWGVTPAGNNIGKWNKINSGDVTLFSRDGAIYSSAVTTYKFHNKNLASFLWDFDSKGQTWEYIYFLDEVREQKIPYINFNRSIGYKDNNIIQGFNVLDEEKSRKVFEDFGLESSTYIPEINQEEYIDLVVDIPSTEESYTAKRRLEQGFLRKKLFSNKTSSKCGCCNKEYPVSMLWCSHIKKRSKCNDDEKRDFNVVLPMCRFGCDELFEKGYISVDNSGNIIGLKKIKNINIKNYLSDIIGAKINPFNESNAKYFEWHRNYHK